MSLRPSARLGIVTGLVAEAECFREVAPDPGLPAAHLRQADGTTFVTACGMGARRADEAARRLAGEGATLLLSFGIAGGLDPRFPPGALILAAAVIDPEGRRFACDAGWRGCVLRRSSGTLPLTVADLAGSDRAVLGAQEKRALFERTGAAAVDMESHAVARVAAEADVPFLALRAVADSANRPLPRTALAGVAEDGSWRISHRFLLHLVGRPWELPLLLRLAVDSRAALRALRRVALSGALFPP